MLENKSNALYLYLRDDNVDAFNDAISKGETADLTSVSFRACDLRGAKLNGLDLSGAYFKNADLRGLDLCKCKLDGASLLNAKASGVLFPADISADEIQMSLTHGTRIRIGC